MSCYLSVTTKMIWEEYLVPLICIAFTSGVVIGINIAMLCSTRFSSKQPMPQFMPAPYPNKYANQQQQQINQNFQQSSPMQYPSGYLQHPNYQSHINNTTAELTANDFRQQSIMKPINRRRQSQNSISFG
tara:strand:- start:6644 stop:7033 length:390 start_codon:yes stop_codon:yes gene_type:complete